VAEAAIYLSKRRQAHGNIGGDTDAPIDDGKPHVVVSGGSGDA
jgi:hypothetical protein